MKLAVLKEDIDIEKRVSVLPSFVEKYLKLGLEVEIESGLATHLNVSDEDFIKKGAKVSKNRKDILADADILLKVAKPNIKEISHFKKDLILISFFDPFFEKESLEKLLSNSITSISMQLLPRTTFAQKMDALSSQANLAGYYSVLLGSSYLKRSLPMMSTPAGTIFPSKVFIVGAGVAGLQAIATAKRLGAKIEAYDTRAVVEEQIKSLGAKFFKIDLGNAESSGGYAKELTKDLLEKQKEALKKALSTCDLIITTAQVFGKKAPIIITNDMVKEMKKGAVVVDLASSTGGNVECSETDRVKIIDGVTILAPSNITNYIAEDASFLYSANLFNLVEHFFDKETKKAKIDLNDEILKNSIMTHQNKIISSILKKA